MDDIRAKIVFTDAGASAALGKVTAAATATGAATKTAGATIGQFGSSLGVAGAALGRVNPAIGSLVSMAGSATGAMQSLTTLGLGPVGIALGVMSVAITAATALWSAHEEQLAKNARALDEVTAASARYAEQQRRARLDELTASEQSAGTSLLTREGRQAAMSQERDRLAGLDRQRGAQDIESLVADYEARGITTEGRGGGRRGGGRARPSLDDLMQGRGRSGAADGLQGLDLSEQQGFQFNGAGPNKDAEGDGMQRGMELDQTLLESQVEREKAASESLKDIYKDTFGTLQEGIAASANAMINGGASAEQAGLMIVAALANQLSKVAMMEGLKEAALAAGRFAVYDIPGGAMHLAAAGAWTLVGAAAGVAGGALSAAAQPSGAGPSTGAGPAPRQQAAAEEGARNITVNFAGGVITAATEAQLARTIRRTVSNTALGAT